MRRGTTPTHTFTLPFSAEQVKVAQIIYAQNGKQVLCKTGDDIKKSGSTLYVRLTQEDTFKFDSRKRVSIQVRVLNTAGDALGSNIMTRTVEECLNEEVLR